MVSGWQERNDACQQCFHQRQLVSDARAGARIGKRVLAERRRRVGQVGRAKVKLVQHYLRKRRSYNTVQAMLDILWKKRRVRRVLLGRAYEYFPSINSEDASAFEIKRVLDRMFCGSTKSWSLHS